MRRTLMTVAAMASVALAGWTPKAWAQSQPYDDDEMDTRTQRGTQPMSPEAQQQEQLRRGAQPMTPEAQQQEQLRRQQEAMRQQQDQMRQQQDDLRRQQEAMRQQQMEQQRQQPMPYAQQPVPYGQQPAPYYQQPQPAPQAVAVPVSTTAQPKKPGFSRYQTSLSVGGGVANFIRDRYSDRASISGAWDARLTVGTRFPIAVEVGYLGTAGTADAPVDSPILSTTQVFGAGRLNLTSWRIQPFLTAGVGWAYLWREGSASESPVAATTFNKSDNAVMFPFGGGLATYLGEHAMIDGRFDYRLIADKDFVNRGARPDMWVAELRAGYAF